MDRLECTECGSAFEPLVFQCSTCVRQLCWPCATRSTLRRGAPVALRDYLLEHLNRFEEFICDECQAAGKPTDFVPRSIIGQMIDHKHLTEDILIRHNVAQAVYRTEAFGDQTTNVGDISRESFHDTSAILPAQGPQEPEENGPPNEDENELFRQQLQERLTQEERDRQAAREAAGEAEAAAALAARVNSTRDGGHNLPVNAIQHPGPTAGDTGPNQAAQPPPREAGHTQYQYQGQQHPSPMSQESFDAFIRLTQQQYRMQELQFQQQEERFNRLLKFTMDQVNNTATRPPPADFQRSNTSSTGIVPKFAMPKCTIPEFSGAAPLEYFTWRQRFTLWVEGFDPTYKMACLLPVLKGQALKKVQGLGTTAEAYPLALKVLDDAYGDINRAIHEAEKRIKDSPAVPANLAKFEDFVDTNRNAYNFLKQQKLSDDRLSTLVPLLVGKLPRHVCEKVLMALDKREWASVTMPELLDRLEDIRKLCVAASAYTTAGTAEPKRAEKSGGKQTTGHQPTMLYSNGQPEKKVKGNQKKNNSKPNKSKTGTHTSGNRELAEPICAFCGGRHPSQDCRTFPNPKERRDRIYELRRCFRCLKEGHLSKECKKYTECKECGRFGHHTLIHDEFWNKETKEKKATQMVTLSQQKDSSPPTTATALLRNAQEDGTSVLATFDAQASSKVAKTRKNVLVLCDGASTVTCLRDDIARDLQLPTLNEQTMTISAFGSDKPTRATARQVCFSLETSNGYSIPITAWTVPCISAPAVLQPLPWTPEQEEAVRKRHPGILNMPPAKDTRRSFDLILGLDYYNAILHAPGATVHHLFDDDKLVVNYTPVGPLLYGFHSAKTTKSSKKAGRHHTQLVNISTNEDVERLFGFELAGVKPWELQDEHTAAVEQLRESLRRTSTGSYEMLFPLRFPLDDLPDGKATAVSRLHHWYKQLKGPKNDQSRVALYDKQIIQLLEAGILETVDESAPPLGPVHYLPHFGVFKESATTAVRPVVDPSQPSKKGAKALNEYFYSGPNLLGNLIGFLIRSRLPPILISCDIAKAFFMLGLRHEHSDLTRIIWLKNPRLPPTADNQMVLRLTRIPFGFAPSPFLLHYTLLHHLAQYSSVVARMMEQNAYVDNLALHANSTTEALSQYKESKEILAEAAMNLRQYVANDQDFNEAIPEADRGDAVKTKLLGVRWDVATDTWAVCKAPVDIRSARTKRDVARHAASIWDPLGIVSPVVLKMRLVLRELCIREIGYDEEMPPDIRVHWKEAAAEVEQLHCFAYPRRAIPNPSQSFHLVAFADASDVGHGFCVYAVQGNESHLLYGRSSGTPTKLTDTPKLEMIALLRAAQAIDFLLGVLPPSCEIVDRRIYSDSLISVHQVYTTRTDLSVFARNRVQKIREIMRRHQVTVHHIAGTDNPADFASRGITFAELISTSWLHGPPFLRLSRENWPKWEGAQLDSLSEPGLKMAENQVLLNVRTKKEKKGGTEEEPGPFGILASDCKSVGSGLNKVIYCQRFINATKKLPVPKHLYPSAEEKRWARLQWTRTLQQSTFKETLELLLKKKSNKSIRKEKLFLDKEGDLRVGSRMQNADLPMDACFPHLLPSNHPWTHLLILESHVDVKHYRTEYTLVQFRRRYWIYKGRKTIERAIRDCFECRRSGGQSYAPPSFGPYPIERVDVGVAGRHVGIDICGPFIVLINEAYAPMTDKKRPQKTEVKIWVLVYTCLVTKFVDLEILPNYTGLAVAMALRRAFARRGVPRSIFSDWGANLLFGLAHVKQHTSKTNPAIKDQEKLTSFLADKEVAVKQIPVRAPYSGGAWESLVRLVKTPLHKLFWDKTVDYDTFHTALWEISATLNSRPLTYVGRNTADGLLITPSLFIAPSTRLALPASREEFEAQGGDPRYDEPGTSNDKTLENIAPKLLKLLARHWKLFQSAYFQHLEESHRNKFPPTPGQHRRPPEPGDVCLLKDPAPRNTWAMCRVTEILPSVDGKVRVVKIATKNTKPGKETPRHVKELIPLVFSQATPKEDQPTVKPHEIDPNLDQEDESEDEYETPIAQITVGLQNLATSDASETPDIFYDADQQLTSLATQILQQKEKEEKERGTAEEYTVNEDDRGQAMEMMNKVAEDAISASPLLRRASKTPYALMFLVGLLVCCATPATAQRASDIIRLSPAHLPLPTQPPTLQGYQLCVETRSGGQAILLPSGRETCDLPPSYHEEEEVQVTVWTPSDELPSSPAIRCTLETVRIVTYTSVFMGYGVISENTGHLNNTSVPPELCRQVWRTLFYEGSNLIQVEKNTWATQRNLTDLFKWCCYAKVNEVQNFVITAGTVAAAQHDAMSSDLGSLGGCHLQELSCRQPDYTIVWDPRTLDDYCPYHRKGTYSATANKDLLVIPDLQAALTLTPAPSEYPFLSDTCLPTGTYLTQEGPAVVFESDAELGTSYKPSFDPTFDNATKPAGIPSARLLKKLESATELFDTMDPVNAKLHYLAAILEESMDTRFSTLFYQYCTLANQQLYNTVQLIHVDPTRGIRALLGREDVAATLHGDVAYVHQCHSVNVTRIHLSHHVPGETDGVCREFIPVELTNGKLYFIPPGSRDLVPTSPTVPCSEVKPAILPSKEEVKSGQAQWNTISGRVHVTRLNKHAEFTYTKLTFQAPPLYQAHVIYPASAVAAYSAKVRRLEQVLHATINYTSQMTLTPLSVEAALLSVGNALEQTAGSVGAGLSSLLKASSNGLLSLGSSILSPVISLLLNLAIAALVIGLALYLTYIACTSRRLRAFCRKRVARRHQGRGDTELANATTQLALTELLSPLRRHTANPATPQDAVSQQLNADLERREHAELMASYRRSKNLDRANVSALSRPQPGTQDVEAHLH